MTVTDESTDAGEFDLELDRLADDLRSADSAFAFTGAGVSTASGIPPFRGEGGIWET